MQALKSLSFALRGVRGTCPQFPTQLIQDLAPTAGWDVPSRIQLVRFCIADSEALEAGYRCAQAASGLQLVRSSVARLAR